MRRHCDVARSWLPTPLPIILLLGVAACGSSPAASVGTSTVKGHVYLAVGGGPVRPPGSCCPRQPSNSIVSFDPLNGGHEISIRTDRGGAYSVTLPSGRYLTRVDGMAPGGYGQATVLGAHNLTVHPGEVVTSDFLISIGLA